MRCPNCTAVMNAVDVERLYGKQMALDICRGCQLVWFDDGEVLQLAPGGTLQLVSLLADDREGGRARPPIEPGLRCPRCQGTLREVHDRQRDTRFTYGRCEAGHGRLFTYYQFLRAKNFVRALSTAEIDDLRQHIRQINCVNCGAPVDVGRHAVCQFCRTPLAVLDPAQLRRAVDDLGAALARKEPDPTVPIAVALERLRAERAFAAVPDASRSASVLDLVFGNAADPLVAGLRAIRRLFAE